MKTIWKYPLAVIDTQFINMPVGATPLAVQVQKDQVCLWALIDPQMDQERRTIYIYGTGNPTLDAERPANYIGTFQIYDGQLVFHVFIDQGVAA